jgi:nucleoid DNA-binding protein
MENSLTKKDLVLYLSKALKIDQKQAKSVLQGVLDKILTALLEGRNVELRNFGIFEVVVRKSRIGRNPNEPQHDIVIPDRAVAKFRPGKEFKQKLTALNLRAFLKKTPVS